MTQYIDIAALDRSGSFKAYVAQPAQSPKAAIVVIQEIFGINPGIRKMCDDWAGEGYLAIAPGLFWRIEPGIVLDGDRNVAASGEGSIHAAASRTQIWIVPTNEELIVARQAKELLSTKYNPI